MRSVLSGGIFASILAASAVSADTIDRFANQTQFILQSDVSFYSNGNDTAGDAEFDKLYVQWDLSSDKEVLTLISDVKNASAFSIIPSLGYPLGSANTDEYVGLYPNNTAVEMFDNGTVIARDPSGKVLSNDGPGDLWSLTLSTDIITKDADPTEHYGLVFNNNRFLNWAACKSPTAEDPNRKLVYWQRAPGNIHQPAGCYLLQLVPLEYNFTATHELTKPIPNTAT